MSYDGRTTAMTDLSRRRIYGRKRYLRYGKFIKKLIGSWNSRLTIVTTGLTKISRMRSMKPMGAHIQRNVNTGEKRISPKEAAMQMRNSPLQGKISPLLAISSIGEQDHISPDNYR